MTNPAIHKSRPPEHDGQTGQAAQIAPTGAGTTSSALRNKAIRWLSRREYSRAELCQRLLRAGPSLRGEEGPVSATDVDAVLAQLVELDLQSDERFAESLLRRRGPREGRALIAQKLKAHNIDPQIAGPLLDRLTDSEFERAYAVWSRRYGAQPESWIDKSRQARFLTSRGFATHIISRILNGQRPG